jgi:hypothetical protein
VFALATVLPASANSVSLAVGQCSGGGGSYEYATSSTSATVNYATNYSCIRRLRVHWWDPVWGDWIDTGWSQDDENVYWSIGIGTDVHGVHEMLYQFSTTGEKHTYSWL